MKSCVVSGSPPEYVRQGLQLTGLLDFFEPHILSAAMVRAGKPAPDLFLYSAEQMGVAPVHCLVIEDSSVGFNAANVAGMLAFWFLGGSYTGLKRRPPDFRGRVLLTSPVG